jgi:hypothetical protein
LKPAKLSVSIWILRDIESDLTAARLEEFHRRKAEMKEELFNEDRNRYMKRRTKKRTKPPTTFFVSMAN